MEKYKQIFDKNIIRVNSLCNLYYSIKSENTKESKEYKFTDLLRSAIVMLHSSFEEYYRNILCEILFRNCTEVALKSISFLGNGGKHKDKISLVELSAFKDKSVEDIIRESICETLGCTSFNDFNDIISWAKKADIDLSTFTECEKIENVIRRRHKIVHEADNSRSDGGYKLTSIAESTVREYITIVCDLVNVIDSQIVANFIQVKSKEI